jgi:RNA polymerase sigma factor (sigma-70 family)
VLGDVGSRRFRMNGDIVEDSLAARAGRLFAQYRDGDQAKMGELVRVLTPILWHTARSSRLDSATAEDVLQSVWLMLIRKSDTITEPLAVLQWMVVTTKREAWRVARNQTRLRPEDLESSTTATSNDGQSVEDTVLRDEGDARLWRHVAALPERCRTLLRVIAFADRPDYAELAKALGMPQGSIGPTRGRCLAKLRISLAQDPTWEHR